MDQEPAALRLAAVPVLAALAACTPAVPSTPTFAKDVGPILAAHCVRCHGPWGDGGALVTDTTTPLRFPKTCYLDAYGDRGDCSSDAAPTGESCKTGARSCAALIPACVTTGCPNPMPPPPSPLLNAWEIDVVKRWAAEQPPLP